MGPCVPLLMPDLASVSGPLRVVPLAPGLCAEAVAGAACPRPGRPPRPGWGPQILAGVKDRGGESAVIECTTTGLREHRCAHPIESRPTSNRITAHTQSNHGAHPFKDIREAHVRASSSAVSRHASCRCRPKPWPTSNAYPTVRTAHWASRTVPAVFDQPALHIRSCPLTVTATEV